MAMSAAAAAEPLAGALLGVGKWDRFMTPGRKVQDGVEFDFSPATFAQILANLQRIYTTRRLPLDFRHAATRDSDAPEQNLAYYNAFAIVIDDAVTGFWSQDPAVPPPDPVRLLADLRGKFPRAVSVDGLWGCKCEITPLGVQKLPNMEQLSPLFSKDDSDEQGNPIGYSLLNVSAVGIAFQDGTLINLSKRKPDMAKTKTAFGGSIPEQLLGKLKKHGLSDEQTKEAVMDAYESYMADTEDGPADRKAMSACMAKAFDDEPEKKDDTETTGDKGQMGRRIRQGAENDPAVAKLVGDLTGQLGSMTKKLEAMEREKAEKAYHEEAAHFTTKADADEYLKLSGGNTELALSFVRKLRPTGMGHSFRGGSPIGGGSPAGSGAPADVTKVVNGGRVHLHGFAFSKKAKQIAEERKIPLGDAQRIVAREHPELLPRTTVS